MRANPAEDLSEASVAAVSELRGEGRLPVTAELTIEQAGFPVAELHDPIWVAGETGLVQSLVVPRVLLWSASPGERQPLYQARLRLLTREGGLLDQRETRFGVRRFELLPGGAAFSVNGRTFPLRAVLAEEGGSPVEVCRELAAAGATLLAAPPGRMEDLWNAADIAGFPLLQMLGDPLQAPGVIAAARSHPSLLFWGVEEAVSQPAIHELLDLEDPERPRLAEIEWTAAPAEAESGGAAGIVARQELQRRLEELRLEKRPAWLRNRGAGALSAARCAWAPLLPVVRQLRRSAAAVEGAVLILNDGAAEPLMNVVLRILALDGREIYSENLAAEAPAGGWEEAGDFRTQIAAGEGPLLVLLEAVDSEGDLRGRNWRLLLPEGAEEELPETKLERTPGGIRNAGGCAALDLRGAGADGFPLLPGETVPAEEDQALSCANASLGGAPGERARP